MELEKQTSRNLRRHLKELVIRSWNQLGKKDPSKELEGHWEGVCKEDKFVKGVRTYNWLL